MESTHLTSKNLEDSFSCLYKVALNKDNVIGNISDFEKMHLEIKQNISLEYERYLISKGVKRDDLLLSNAIFTEKAYTANIVCHSSKYSIKFDFVEISDNKLVPVYISPTISLCRWHKIYLTCLSILLKQINDNVSDYGKIISKENGRIKVSQVRFSTYKKEAQSKLLIDIQTTAKFCLTKQCQICEYYTHCYNKAIELDHLSLLNKMVSKKIKYYENKGIFTVTQLSYLYRPRKKRKGKETITHNIELQALAIRTNKIYVKRVPEFKHSEVEIFIDIEGVPEYDFYYLVGVLVKSKETHEYHYFWTDDRNEEEKMWKNFFDFINLFPAVPIFHYGNYETNAIKKIKHKYGIKTDNIEKQLFNINKVIYGQVYFPVYSNSLKDIGKYIGASWSKDNSSGIQCIVWRYNWENQYENRDFYKSTIINYNKEDCYALAHLLEKLMGIENAINSGLSLPPSTDFADTVNNDKMSEVQNKIHKQFGAILNFAHENYDNKKFSLQKLLKTKDPTRENNQSVRVGITRKRPNPKVEKRLSSKRICPICKAKLIISKKIREQIVTDIIFTKNTVRKTVIRYYGNQSFCSKCSKYYAPPQINNMVLGHNYKVWLLYQRMYLRLPYRIIEQNMLEMFDEQVCQATITNTLKYFANYYKNTSKILLREILNSPFIHVDETIINVKGYDCYVWILTNGKNVFFKLTSTRESTMIKELLQKYEGVLISDFYPGYDSLKCRQQKCWVHLIRDLNDDLRKNPFNLEYEKFVLQVKELMLPIFETIDKYGLKKRHLNKFIPKVDSFYESITNSQYKSEITQKYQSRFLKNRNKLFVFLHYDNIPWNNNMAERGLRHIAIQRKISMYFSDGIDNYLLLLGIMQTCRFSEQSFLKFLISAKKNL